MRHLGLFSKSVLLISGYTALRNNKILIDIDLNQYRRELANPKSNYVIELKSVYLKEIYSDYILWANNTQIFIDN